MKLGPISSTFVLIVAISILALLYLNQITKTNVFGYRVTQMQKQAADIQATKQDLEVEAARLQSIQEVQKSPKVAAMTPESAVSYAR